MLDAVKKLLISFLKSAAIKAALKAVLGTATGGGFFAWVIKIVAVELFEELAEPVIRAVFNHVGYLYDRKNGEIHVKKLEEAKKNNDHESYKDTVNDIFS
jgi:glycosyltransferase A (GT-A) superfamily protein (DUF2064 family)